jgi:hypothetical protein
MEAQRKHKTSLIVAMMTIPSTSIESSSIPGGQGNHGERIPQAALTGQPTSTVETAQATADANCPIDGNLTGTMQKGKVIIGIGKVYMQVIAMIIWLCYFLVDSIMVCYIQQQGL